MPSDLRIGYDKKNHPVGGRCTICGEEMVVNQSKAMRNPGDIIVEYAKQFMVHRQEKHPETVSKWARLG